MSLLTGLSPEHRVDARDRTVEAALLIIRKRSGIFYSQGAHRWDGISRDMVARKGQYPKLIDCSSAASWCLWNGLYVPFGVRDVVNGTRTWDDGGFTGTMLVHGVKVQDIDHALRGDCIFYGRPGSTGAHVTLHLGGGWVMSMGGNVGPLKLRWNYRKDVMGIRGYIR